MITIRLSKALMVLAMAFFASLVAFNNVTDYGTNFAFVHHVFLMDTTFPGNQLMYRAIETPWVHHAGYLGIIALKPPPPCSAGSAACTCCGRARPMPPASSRPSAGPSPA